MVVRVTQLEKNLERIYKAIAFFRNNKEKLTLEQYIKYNNKFCDLVEATLDNLEGRLTMEEILEIFPNAKITND